MLGLGKTSAVRASATADPARNRDIYQRYAVALYRQVLLARDTPALAEHAGCDVIVNERALAAMPERGEDDGRYPPAPSQTGDDGATDGERRRRRWGRSGRRRRG
jgi:hypothetical protein